MRLIACMSWYSENPAWLAATIASLAKLDVDHLVAVDGAYFLLPEGKPHSGSEQHDAIHETAKALGMGLTLYAPQTVWYGNEVEKRSFMFSLANLTAEPLKDWLMVMDADQLVDKPIPLKDRLAGTELDVAEVMFEERQDLLAPKVQEAARQFDWPQDTRTPIRILFRAIPGLHVKGNHYTYMTPDGRKLWGNAKVKDGSFVECLDLTELVIEHRSQFRDRARRSQQLKYYARRDEAHVETPPCDRCGERPGTNLLGTDFKASMVEGVHANWTEVCDECRPEVDDENRRRLDYYRPVLEAGGIKPEDLEQYGVRAYEPA